VCTYQALHAALVAEGTLDARYRAYLAQRYSLGSPDPT
jgi:hypothetical protein